MLSPHVSNVHLRSIIKRPVLRKGHLSDLGFALNSALKIGDPALVMAVVPL